MKTLLSLFDYSGAWSAPFLQNGWNVIQWDIKIDEFMDINLISSADVALDLFDHLNGIIGGPPCTDFAVSGAWKWSEKDANGQTEKSVQIVNQFLRLVDLYTPTDPDYDEVWFWSLENPVGRIGTLCNLDDPYWFHPHDFAGYVELDAASRERLEIVKAKQIDNISTDDAMFIMATNRYTKKTGLWGDFNRSLIRKPETPVRCANQGSPLQKLGGKSERTKTIRSITPEGFSQAFYLANNDYAWTPDRYAKQNYHQPNSKKLLLNL